MPGIALPYPVLGEVGNLLSATARASNLAIWPAQFNHQRVAILVVGEVENGFLECVYAVHEVIIGL
jgi:hypothetical protein